MTDDSASRDPAPVPLLDLGGRTLPDFLWGLKEPDAFPYDEDGNPTQVLRPLQHTQVRVAWPSDLDDGNSVPSSPLTADPAGSHEPILVPGLHCKYSGAIATQILLTEEGYIYARENYPDRSYEDPNHLQIYTRGCVADVLEKRIGPQEKSNSASSSSVWLRFELTVRDATCLVVARGYDASGPFPDGTSCGFASNSAAAAELEEFLTEVDESVPHDDNDDGDDRRKAKLFRSKCERVIHFGFHIDPDWVVNGLTLEQLEASEDELADTGEYSSKAARYAFENLGGPQCGEIWTAVRRAWHEERVKECIDAVVRKARSRIE